MNILLFNPALKDTSGALNDNLGDCIIWEAVERHLKSIFQGSNIQSISSHVAPDNYGITQIKAAAFRFVGGSNLLSSNMRHSRQWKMPARKMAFRHPAILMGVGWQDYQSTPDRFTALLLRSVLSQKHLHAVRDSYTEAQLRAIGFKNVINTSCPTLWDWAGEPMIMNKQDPARKVLLMVTDYRINETLDKNLVQCLADQYEEIYFWPQGRNDRYYGSHLLFNVRSKVQILDGAMESLEALLASDISIDYVGTRLHGGIKCLKAGKRSLIIETDNRAKEIGRDTGLPTVPREDFAAIRRWTSSRQPCTIHVPREPISRWKQQFANCVA